MTLVLFTISSSAINALALNRAGFFCSKFIDHGERERKRHDLTCEKLQKVGDEWNESWINQLEFYNIKLHQKNETSTYSSNVDEVMLAYHRVLL